jgi:heme/copper-type cytochrome/quinol oxidase subunit 2
VKLDVVRQPHTKKQLVRAALLLGAIIFVLVAVVLVFFAIPYVAGPNAK